MVETSVLISGVIFGALGLGFFIYGKKQGAFIPLFCGIGLMIVPYFTANIYILIISGLVLILLPYFIRF